MIAIATDTPERPRKPEVTFPPRLKRRSYMLGTIIALLAWAWKVVMGDLTPTAALHDVLPFLWYWHMVFGVLIGAIAILMLVLLLLMIIFGDKKEKLTGFLGTITSPLWLVLCLSRTALYLGGVYALQRAYMSDGTFNSSKAIVGAVLYGTAILLTLAARGSSK